MKGVILAGGAGTRLLPLTERINKHLLPVYNRPMIFYPIEFLKRLGVGEFLIVTNRENAGLTEDILGDGRRFGVDLTYKVQEYSGNRETGIAKALALAEKFSDGGRLLVQLADNIFNMQQPEMRKLRNSLAEIDEGKGRYPAYVFLNKISDPVRFGVPEFAGGKIVRIEENPKKPKSKFVVTGLYCYDSSVFEIIKGIRPSPKGTYEITEVNGYYVDRGMLGYFKMGCDWIDAGTFEGLFAATQIIRRKTIY